MPKKSKKKTKAIDYFTSFINEQENSLRKKEYGAVISALYQLSDRPEEADKKELRKNKVIFELAKKIIDQAPYQERQAARSLCKMLAGLYIAAYEILLKKLQHPIIYDSLRHAYDVYDICERDSEADRRNEQKRVATTFVAQAIALAQQTVTQRLKLIADKPIQDQEKRKAIVANLFKMAKTEFTSGRFERAIHYYTKWIEYNPGSAVGYFELGKS